jgi:RHH-type rel operon transcriptional repressor/antitoxin RelB
MSTCIHAEVIVATSIRLASELSNRLDQLALKTGRTKAFYLREMIEGGIGEMEDYYLAAETLQRVRKGKERVHSAAAVRKDLGLDD